MPRIGALKSTTNFEATPLKIAARHATAEAPVVIVTVAALVLAVIVAVMVAIMLMAAVRTVWLPMKVEMVEDREQSKPGISNPQLMSP